MNLLSIKAYGQKHKLSLFNVMKMTKSGKLESHEVEVDGKMRMMIVDDTEKKNSPAVERKAEKKALTMSEMTEEITKLQESLALLRKEVESLKQQKSARVRF